MNKKQLTYKNKLLDAISFSRENEGYLTTVEIILIHQHLNLDKSLTATVKNKINQIQQLTEQLEWERPVTRYNSEYQIEKLNTKTGLWQIVK
jgi:CII-binding regulator of phage lambda lysogenization HflD